MTGDAARKLTAEDLDRFLGIPAETGELRAYLEAAAVLSAFDPARLRPAGAGESTMPALPDGLLSRSEPITQGPDSGLWSLILPERRAALRRLAGRGEVTNALAANPDRPDTPLQHMFEKLVSEPQEIPGTPADLVADLSRGALAALLTLHDWVEGILDGLPARDDIDRALTRFDLLAPLRRLTEAGFVGRHRELEQLDHYVFGPEPAAPLFVHGSGGVGKSTLIAQFILDQVLVRDVPIVYLDIDRPTLRPDQPMTILLHALVQLEPQLGLTEGTVDALTKEISYAISRVDASRSFESSTFSAEQWLLEQFAGLVSSARPGSVMLMVLDTFEEAQYLGTDVVWPLVRFLLEITRLLPGLRLVLSGRALPEEFMDQAFPGVARPAGTASTVKIPLPHRPINLGILDQESARELLQRSLVLAGLPELRSSELDDVIGVVSRNAMCLKLAARLLRDEGVDQLRGSRSQFLTRLKAEKIQALLYGRILRHLHTDEARAVAYPGIVVRRIAPDVIRDVLAEPCDLKLRPGHDEYAVFEELRTEAALVEVDPEDGSLRHRSDVRRSVLEDLTDHVSREVIEQIDRAAVGFYEGRSGAVNRAEEIYHRLRLGESTADLEVRWSPEAAARLKNAGEELPAQQRLWLAHKLGVTLDPSVRRAANQEMWEEHAATSAERFLSANAPEQALAVLRERPDRCPRSKLYRLEAEAYRLLGRWDEALSVGRAGVDAASRAGAVDLALEQLLQMVVIEEGRGNLEPAARLMEETSVVAVHSSDLALRFRVTITGLRLFRRLHPDAHEELAACRATAAASVTEELMYLLRSRPVLLREAAAELGETDARLVSAAIETLGAEVADDVQARAFGHAIDTAAESSSISLAAAFVDGARHFRLTGFDPEQIRQWVTGVLKGQDTRLLARSLAGVESGADVLRAFQDYFRVGVDNSLRGPVAGDDLPPVGQPPSAPDQADR